MNHSPEPWTMDRVVLSDSRDDLGIEIMSDKTIVAFAAHHAFRQGPQDLSTVLANAERIVACVNACQGIPDINGTITLIADMKTAILTGDPELLEIVRKRLVELADWPPGTGVPEYDEMEPLLFPRRSHEGPTTNP